MYATMAFPQHNSLKKRGITKIFRSDNIDRFQDQLKSASIELKHSSPDNQRTRFKRFILLKYCKLHNLSFDIQGCKAHLCMNILNWSKI